MTTINYEKFFNEAMREYSINSFNLINNFSYELKEMKKHIETYNTTPKRIQINEIIEKILRKKFDLNVKLPEKYKDRSLNPYYMNEQLYINYYQFLF